MCMGEAQEDYLLLLDRERTFPSPADYLYNGQQPQLTLSLRVTLFEWSSKVNARVDVPCPFTDWVAHWQAGESLNLKADTMASAMRNIDRFFSLQSVHRNTVQLVGIVCILVAASFHEQKPPTLEALYIVPRPTKGRSRDRSMG